MIEYRKGNFLIQSDFEIRSFMEEGPDIDLIIPLEYRTLNLYIDGMPDYFDSRLQLLDIKNILIRFSTLKDNNLCTIHFLRNIDLKSAVMNFVFDYKEHFIKLKEEEYSAEMHIEKRKTST
ncbi:MAG: hypothetical protein GXZ06_05240 [Tissierellia bacterium]|nr:hypothetical protein [Tissierellia bacterium]